MSSLSLAAVQKESDSVEQPFECLAQNFYNHYNEALEGMVAAAV